MNPSIAPIGRPARSQFDTIFPQASATLLSTGKTLFSNRIGNSLCSHRSSRLRRLPIGMRSAPKCNSEWKGHFALGRYRAGARKDGNHTFQSCHRRARINRSNFNEFVGVAGEIPAGAVAEVRKQGINTLIGLRLPGFVLYLSGLYVDDIKSVHLHLSELRAAAGPHYKEAPA